MSGNKIKVPAHLTDRWIRFAKKNNVLDKEIAVQKLLDLLVSDKELPLAYAVLSQAKHIKSEQIYSIPDFTGGSLFIYGNLCCTGDIIANSVYVSGTVAARNIKCRTFRASEVDCNSIECSEKINAGTIHSNGDIFAGGSLTCDKSATAFSNIKANAMNMGVVICNGDVVSNTHINASYMNVMNDIIADTFMHIATPDKYGDFSVVCGSRINSPKIMATKRVVVRFDDF